MKNLGVNIDHVATLRQARGTKYPSVLEAARLALQAGADQITVHLRDDRRHIQDADVLHIRQELNCRLNLEMAATKAMLSFALKCKPDMVTLVPEKREELTTEGGLNVGANSNLLSRFTQELEEKGVRVSFFIDPEQSQIEATLAAKAQMIELHTGEYANAENAADAECELQRLKNAAQYAERQGLVVAAGHGLHCDNLPALVKQVPQIVEYNIGHAIVARALFVGLEKAIKEIVVILNEGEGSK